MEARIIYFDGCPDWRIARERLDQAIELAGIGAVSVVVRCIITCHEATGCGLCGSPTILIDGADPFAGVDPRAGIYRRRFATEDGPDVAPSVAQLVAVLRRPSEGGRTPDRSPAGALLPAMNLAELRVARASATRAPPSPSLVPTWTSAEPRRHPRSRRARIATHPRIGV